MVCHKESSWLKGGSFGSDHCDVKRSVSLYKSISPIYLSSAILPVMTYDLFARCPKPLIHYDIYRLQHTSALTESINSSIPPPLRMRILLQYFSPSSHHFPPPYVRPYTLYTTPRIYTLTTPSLPSLLLAQKKRIRKVDRAIF